MGYSSFNKFRMSGRRGHPYRIRADSGGILTRSGWTSDSFPLILNLLKDERERVTRRPYAIIRPMFPPLRQIAARFSGRRRAALNFLIVHSGLLICALFLLAGLALAGDYGVNQDERRQREIATVNLNYILGQNPADNPVIKPSDRFYGVAFELPLLLAERLPGMSDYHYVHRLRLTLTHLFFIIAAFCCYRLAYHLGGNRLIALLALLLFLLHPRLYAHSYLNSKDLPFLSMFVIALYLLERAFRRDTVAAFALLGLAVGLLTNLRIAGIMLLPAALALRGLDLFHAADWPERKHILRTAGLFLLAAGLTFYAVTPHAWVNPVSYLTSSLALTVDHPDVGPVLFQGEWISAGRLPPHYLPTWFGITTPPPVMLLGLVGIAVALARGLARPGAAFRNNRRRFQLLLLAVFLLPPLAAALLGSNLFNGWRHFYFVYGPFCLLAALGGGWLLAALSRQRRPAAGLYGLVGLGLGLVLLQLAQLHPLQYSYFNFLVDRITPEHLRTQYRLDYWELAFRDGLEHLLERHPTEALVVGVEWKHTETLPPAARRRLRRAAAGRRADYELTNDFAPSRPDLAFNSVYRRFYHNALVAVRPLDSARMTPAATAAYRELYRQALAAEPIIRGDYAVYLNGKRLTFIRENCPPDSRDAWLGVKIFPHDPENLPPGLRDGYSYATYGNQRVRLGDTCLAILQLPDYARGDLFLERRNIGNFGPVSGLPLWEELYSVSRPGLQELIAQGRRKQPQPAGPEAFDVFLDREGNRNRLLYAKLHCSQAEYETPVTLHLYPENLVDLPFYLWKDGLDNRDFLLSIYGGRPGGECIAVFPLPDYPIAAIHTGQGGRWAVNLYPPTEPDRLRATYAALSTSQPAARAAFALYLLDNRLIYLREICAAADMAAGFFLHIIPEDAADLPPERQAAGFANLDFAFDRRGGPFDGKCLAAVSLPNYSIKEIRTGQYIPGQGEVWAVELMVGQ